MRRYAHIMVAVPTRGQIGWQTATALEAARDYSPALGPIVYQAGSLSVALTRNRIVARFLESGCEKLAMIDDDIAPPVNFLELLDPYVPEYAMVTLPHPMPHPSEPGTMIFSAFDVVEDGLQPKGLWTGINEVGAAATGCVLIGRECLEELGPAPFRISHDPRDAVQSDDFLFCEDLRKEGFRIGCYYDGHFVDHFRTAGLEPLLRAQLAKGPA